MLKNFKAYLGNHIKYYDVLVKTLELAHQNDPTLFDTTDNILFENFGDYIHIDDRFYKISDGLKKVLIDYEMQLQAKSIFDTNIDVQIEVIHPTNEAEDNGLIRIAK